MDIILKYIRRRLSLRLGLLIVLIVTVIFSMVFDFLFYQVKQHVRQAAIDRANLLLENTVARINGIMADTETVTDYMAAVTPLHLSPDSLLAFTRRNVASHSFLTGFAISMEPYFFPEMGRYFSAYSLRQDDTITTVREGPYEYFEKVWYKSPRTLGAPCWVDAFDDYNEGTLSSPDIMTSYCCPMRDADGRYIGSITASLTLKWLSEMVTAVQPYPNSAAIMIDRSGTYIVHPDTAKLYRQTIFSDPDPKARDDIQRLGKAMLAGRNGMVQTIVDGREAYIFYRPLERTGWSIAIVCPAIDVFGHYDRLLATVWTLIGIGLLLLLLFCYLTVRKALTPLHQLATQAGRIADGQFDEPLPHSSRTDSVGRLTNSFILMQQSLATTVADIRRVNTELEQQNEELKEACRLRVETSRRKTEFIREMFHQIRTPLNIVGGFTQVLTACRREMGKDELSDITARMKQSAADISHIAKNLLGDYADDDNKQPFGKLKPTT